MPNCERVSHEAAHCYVLLSAPLLKNTFVGGAKVFFGFIAKKYHDVHGITFIRCVTVLQSLNGAERSLRFVTSFMARYRQELTTDISFFTTRY